jgi:CHAD domain-containing protein
MSPTDLHDWRKRVKTLWYQLRLVRPFAPTLGRRIRDFERLQELLGDDHDLYVLQAMLGRTISRPPAQSILVRTSSEHARLQGEAFTRGARLFGSKPTSWSRRLERAFRHSSAARRKPAAA